MEFKLNIDLNGLKVTVQELVNNNPNYLVLHKIDDYFIIYNKLDSGVTIFENEDAESYLVRVSRKGYAYLGTKLGRITQAVFALHPEEER